MTKCRVVIAAWAQSHCYLAGSSSFAARCTALTICNVFVQARANCNCNGRMQAQMVSAHMRGKVFCLIYSPLQHLCLLWCARCTGAL